MRQFGHNDVEILEEKTAWSGFWKLKLFRLRHRRFAGGWSETLTRELTKGAVPAAAVARPGEVEFDRSGVSQPLE